MIGKAKACIGGAALANYVMKPEKGYELMRNGVSGQNPTEILNEMKVIQDLNQRAEKRTFSLVLSPERKEGQRLTDDQLRKMTVEFMSELGIDPETHQFVAFVHTEKAHKHIHIIANRVTDEGKLLSDHHIGKRAQWVAHRIAKKYGLISAKERQIENLKVKKRGKNNLTIIKQKIKKKHDKVLSRNIRYGRDYISLMKGEKIEVIPIYNKFSNKLQGLRMKDLESDIEFKASDIHRSMSLNKIIESGISFEDLDDMEKENEYENENIIKSPVVDFFGNLPANSEQEGYSRKRKRKSKDDREIER